MFVLNLKPFLCFCLEIFVQSRIFHSFGDVTIAGEELQILTYARHLWPLCSEGSLIYCSVSHKSTVTRPGHTFIMVISEDLWHSYIMPIVWQWSCHYLFLRIRSVATWIRTPNPSACGANVLTHGATATAKPFLSTMRNVRFLASNLSLNFISYNTHIYPHTNSL